MTLDACLTLALLLLLFVLLVKTKIPAPAIFMGALTIAITLDLAPPEQLLKGFSNPGMLTVAVLFMVAAGMYATGAITMIMDKLIGLPRSIVGAQLKILPPIAFGSAFLNNTPLVAMMIPVVRDISQSARLAATKLYIPLSFASILGGASTLIGTSTNLIIAGLVADAIAAGALTEMEPISIFDPTLIGLPAAIVGIAFLIIIGQRLLPEPPEKAAEAAEKRFYRAEFIVLPDSPLIGKTVGDAGLASADGYELIALEQEAAEVEPLPEPAAEPKRISEKPQNRRGIRRQLRRRTDRQILSRNHQKQ